MTTHAKILAAVSLLALLTACQNDTGALRSLPNPTGDKFAATLTSEYRRAADYEATTEGEWDHADALARKGLAAAKGEKVLPEDGSTGYFKVTRANAELTDYRGRLMFALDNGGRQNTPEACAKAQVRYDEWLEEVAEIADGSDPTIERAKFMAALPACIGQAAAAAPPASAPPAAVAEQPNFTVYFAFDSAKLDGPAKAIVQSAANFAKDHTDTRIAMAGHTDTAGSKDYNIRLSLRRADAVRAEMISDGIPASRLSVTALGESQLAVPTAEGVREARNRRVVIDVK